MKKITAIIIIALLSLNLWGCIHEEEEPDPQKISRWIEKELSKEDIFTIEKNTKNIKFSKIGTVEAGTTANIAPQVSGKIEEITVNINDVVEKYDTLVKLGDSLSTDMSEIQYRSALKGLNIVNSSLYYTEKAARENIQTAKINAEVAYDSYQNAKESKKNAMELYYLQHEELEDNIDDLENAYKDAKDNYKDADNALDNAYKTDETSTIESASQAKEATKSIKEQAKKALEQAKNSLEQMELNNESQINQLNFAITSARSQYEIAQNRLQSAKIGLEQQILSIESQKNQAETGVEQAELNIDYKKVKSPITGMVTQIYAEKGNLISPGQTVIVVENNDSFTVKSSINETEKKYIYKGNKVIIETPEGIVEGNISTIAKSNNPKTKKIDIEILVAHTKKIKSQDLVTIYFTAKTNDKIFIPLNSVHLDNERKYVKTINSKGFIEYRTVKTGNTIENYIEITDGLRVKDKILKATTTNFNENNKVIITD